MELIRKRDPLPEPHPEHFARARRVSAQRNACRNAGLKARDMRGDIPMSVVEHANCHVVCSDRTYLRTCDGVGVCEQSRYRSNLRGTASTPVESCEYVSRNRAAALELPVEGASADAKSRQRNVMLYSNVVQGTRNRHPSHVMDRQVTGHTNRG